MIVDTEIVRVPGAAVGDKVGISRRLNEQDQLYDYGQKFLAVFQLATVQGDECLFLSLMAESTPGTIAQIIGRHQFPSPLRKWGLSPSDVVKRDQSENRFCQSRYGTG